MTFLVGASTTAASVLAATVLVAAFPDAQTLFAPLIDGNEYAVPTASLLASLPTLALMAVLAAFGCE